MYDRPSCRLRLAWECETQYSLVRLRYSRTGISALELPSEIATISPKKNASPSGTSFFIVSDEIYSDIVFDGRKHVSIASLEPRVKELTITVNGFSKAYAMTGWRIGMAVGNREILAGLGRVKTNVDSGVFNAVQRAAITALSGPQDCVKAACAVYQERRDVLVAGLRSLGFDVPVPVATFYVWLPVQDCCWQQRRAKRRGSPAHSLRMRSCRSR
jgi:histidinol-phosphate/aromatic aminotransferase/cobyric acid decarboxylase-like protein